jgi:hypothetical protein
MTKPTYTIIAPIYNELENIPELYPRMREVIGSHRRTMGIDPGG